MKRPRTNLAAERSFAVAPGLSPAKHVCQRRKDGSWTFRVSDSWSPEYALLPDGDFPDVFSARKAQEIRVGFRHHTLTPSSKQWDHKASRQLRPGGPPRPKHLSEGGGGGTREAADRAC